MRPQAAGTALDDDEDFSTERPDACVISAVPGDFDRSQCPLELAGGSADVMKIASFSTVVVGNCDRSSSLLIAAALMV